MTDASHWPRVKELFERSLSFPPGEREAFVRASVGEHDALGREILELLERDRRDDTALEPGRLWGGEELDTAPGLPSTYRLLGVLGRGGMGTVWLARRADASFERLVAIKVLRRGLDTEDVLRRFALERQVLADLRHAGIAQLHDGGMTDEGLPYLVMELVEGERIDRFCELRKLDLASRLALFEEVCEAVQHAHERGVVHRDLKPSNVLVTEDGRPKLVDFGIAKLVGESDEESSLDLTDTERRLLTPAYASPEQVRGERVSLATDVYALGVILYELVTGERPYHFELGTQAEIERVVCEEPPAAPRRAAPGRVTRDLETILLMALRKEPERRYVSAAALGDDLRRLRERRTVRARPDTPFYRVSRLLRRNRSLVGATAAVIAVLLVGLFVAEAQRRRAAASAEEAREQRDKVLQLSTFVRLEDLEREARELWPPVPEQLAAYEDWLDRAEELTAGLAPRPGDPGHRARLAEIEARATRGPDGLEFAGDADRWWHAKLTELIESIEALDDPERGLLRGVIPGQGWGVERRRDWAARTPASSELWAAAARAIAGAPRYGGLALQPQRDLLPLGANPETGLWEFLHEPSGAPPGAGGSVGEDTGIVFVLLPGGRLRRSGGASEPEQVVELSPFFLAKHELSQGQWLRLEGDEPSFFSPAYVNRDIPFTLAYPLESITWNRAQPALERWGLTLPTEAQWEYGARAGTDTPWWPGATHASLAASGAANLADRSAAEAAFEWIEDKEWEAYDDGWAASAPVDSMAPNPFGLHHVLGNVSEWCLDHFAVDAYARTSERDPVLIVPDGRDRVLRGGSFYYGPRRARSRARHNDLPDYRDFDLGLRAARRLE